MKNTKYYIIIFFAVFTLVGCNKFLDNQPKGFLIPKTAKDYEALLNDGDILKSSETYPIFMTDDAYIPEMDQTGFLPGINNIDKVTKNLYTFQKDVFGQSEMDGFWSYSYNRIYTYNVIIQQIMGADKATDAEKKAIQAQAYLGRAFEYLNLVNAYATHYDHNTADKDLAVPLILDDIIDREELKRATVEEVYDQIKSDLSEAVKHLPNRSSHGAFRGTKSTALGILARMHLYREEYEDALKYATASLEIYDALLDLKEYEVVNPLGAIGRIDVPTLNDNPENIYIKMPPYIYGVSMTVYGSKDLINLYTPNDKRLQLFFTNSPFSIPLQDYLWLPFLESNIAIATPEVYLTAAECEARIGSKDKAMEYVNKLRDYRIEGNTPLTATDNEDALKIVLDERRRELVFQGPSRLFDLKRLNKDPRFAKTITRKIDGKEYSLEPNSPNYVLPIPPKVLRFNPNMVDNIRE